MLDVLFGAAPVEDLLTRGDTRAGGAATFGERQAVVGEELGDLEGSGLQEVRQKALGASSRLSGDPRRDISPGKQYRLPSLGKMVIGRENLGDVEVVRYRDADAIHQAPILVAHLLEQGERFVEKALINRKAAPTWRMTRHVDKAERHRLVDRSAEGVSGFQ